MAELVLGFISVRILLVYLLDRDQTDTRRLVFVFETHEDIQRIQSQRVNGNHIVPSTVYEDCQRRLKSIIHSNKQP